MVWARLDDKFLTNPKTEQAGLCGRALYVAGLLYCSGELTDGYIRESAAAKLAMLAEVPEWERWRDRLVELGLWERADGGYRVHDFLTYNPSRAQIEREREEARGRMRRAREVRANKRRSSGEVRSTDVRSAPARPGPAVANPVVTPVTPVLEVNDSGAKGEPFAADAAPPNGQHAAIRPVPKPKPDLGPLVDAFSAQGLPRPDLADPAERQAAMQLLRSHPPPVVAACWAHLAEHGDSYDRDHLSLLLLSKFNRVGNFVRERDAPARANGIDPRTGAPPGKRGPRHV